MKAGSLIERSPNADLSIIILTPSRRDMIADLVKDQGGLFACPLLPDTLAHVKLVGSSVTGDNPSLMKSQRRDCAVNLLLHR